MGEAFAQIGAHRSAVAFRTCRYCGSELDRARESLAVCLSCADSPLCDRCGHRRSDHSRVFVRRNASGCAHVIRDFQSLSVRRCDCTGFKPVRGPLRDAEFVAPDPNPLMLPLRVVGRDE
jgi:hypothetical protein